MATRSKAQMANLLNSTLGEGTMAGVKGMHKKSYMRPETAERIRDRIVNSQIAERLVKHALGEADMSATQVQAAMGLLRKVLPDLAASEVTHKGQSWVDALEQLAHARLRSPMQDQPEIVDNSAPLQ